ncbi:hypothetical protein PIB30_110618, partial [Stylosanthes scabra]|nr:hypothetical protein [Stylosanthes scabra]
DRGWGKEIHVAPTFWARQNVGVGEGWVMGGSAHWGLGQAKTQCDKMKWLGWVR